MSGGTSLQVVHAAAYALLHGDATLLALATGGVWDYIPEDQAFPLIRLELAEAPDDTAGLQGNVVALLITIASDYRGMKQVYDVLDRVIALLRHTTLTLATGWEAEQLLYRGAKPIEPQLVNGVVVQGLLAEFQVRIWET